MRVLFSVHVSVIIVVVKHMRSGDNPHCVYVVIKKYRFFKLHIPNMN